MTDPQLTYSVVKGQEFFLKGQEQNKGANSHHSYLTQHWKVLARTIRQEKEIKDIRIAEEEVKLSLFTNYMILYIENPKVYKKLLELINKFSKVTRCIINIQKSVAFLYINSKLSEKEIKKSSFTVPSKTIILRNKFSQGGKRSLH